VRLRGLAPGARGRLAARIVATSGRCQPHLPPPAAPWRPSASAAPSQLVDLDALSWTPSAGLGYEAVPRPIERGNKAGAAAATSLCCFRLRHELPVRMEFFGDTFEKLREFDPGQSQMRSLDFTIDYRAAFTPPGMGPLVADALRAFDARWAPKACSAPKPRTIFARKCGHPEGNAAG